MSFHPNDVVRRGRGATFIVCGAMLFLLSAFFRHQVLRNEQSVKQGQAIRLRRLPIPAPRGAILDRHGKVIVESSVAYSVSVLASNRDSLVATLDRLNAIIPITAKTRADAIKRFERDKASRPVVIFPDATIDKVSVLEEHHPDFPNLLIQATPKRFYPAGAAVGSFAGYTAEINEQQLAILADSGYATGQQIGKEGLERQYESSLRGREGAAFLEVNASDRVLGREVSTSGWPPVPGKQLKTTIDLELQQFVYDLFVDSALVGGLVALDPKTGGILALHSAPSIDPNRWIGGIAPKFFADSVLGDPRRPLYNKAVFGTYPPGSTFKLATAVMALQEGVITTTAHMPQSCGGSYYYYGRSWACWEPKGHGSLDLTGAIAKSCDVYFYQVGLRLAISRLAAGGATLGFALRSGVDLPGEAVPQYPPSDQAKMNAYYDAKFGRGRWTGQSEALNLAIGQGANSQTVINMARFYAALANDGIAPTPHFAETANPERKRIFTLDSATIDVIRAAMMDVLEGGGTAAASAIKGVAVAGKTGTAQSGKRVNGVELNHAWFVGYAPAGDPQIVVAVMLEFGGHGSRTAHHATMVMQKYLHRTLRPVTATGG